MRELKLSHEEKIAKYVQDGDKGSAIKLAADLAVAYARQKNFQKADAFHRKIEEIDNMALSEIVRVANVIEEEKTSGIDTKHLQDWAALYDTLSPEEQNVLYYSQKKGVAEEDKAIFKQGERNNKLFFVEEGSLRLVHKQGSREFLIKSMKPLTIAGSDSFFSASLCTSSMLTLSKVKMRFLTHDILTDWEENHQNLLAKLKTYCQNQEDIVDILKKKGFDRRVQKRVRLSGKIDLQLIDANNTPTGSVIAGELHDISTGGISFYFKLRNQEMARKFLGRRLHFHITLPRGLSKTEVEGNCLVISICHNPLEFIAHNDFSIHIKFDETLSEKLIEELARRPKS